MREIDQISFAKISTESCFKVDRLCLININSFVVTSSTFNWPPEIFILLALFLVSRTSPPENSMDSADNAIKSSGSSTPLEDNINVVVRVRPVSEKEIKANDESIAQFPGNGQILVSNVSSFVACDVDDYDRNYSARVRMTHRSPSYSRTTSFSSRAPPRRTFCSTAVSSGSSKWPSRDSTRRCSAMDKPAVGRLTR